VRDPADAESWSEFVSLYEPLLMSYVRKKRLAEDDARDVVQEIFRTLFQALPKFQLDHGRGRFRTWLWRVTYNAIVDFARRRRRREAAEDEARNEAQLAVAPEEIEPDAEWRLAHRHRILDYVLEQVRSKYGAESKTWRSFELHIRQGRPSADVAAELGLSKNAVYVNASRVLALVRELCADYAEDLADA
jgi:RNA polymerase sigma-70 factor (ECF subfamily)